MPLEVQSVGGYQISASLSSGVLKKTHKLIVLGLKKERKRQRGRFDRPHLLNGVTRELALKALRRRCHAGRPPLGVRGDVAFSRPARPSHAAPVGVSWRDVPTGASSYRAAAAAAPPPGLAGDGQASSDSKGFAHAMAQRVVLGNGAFYREPLPYPARQVGGAGLFPLGKLEGGPAMLSLPRPRSRE